MWELRRLRRGPGPGDPASGGTVAPPLVGQAPGFISGSIVLDLWRRSAGKSSSKNGMEYYGPKRVTCDPCSGTGWILPKTAPPDGWPDRCMTCYGKGDLSLHSIATAIDEDPGALYRLLESRVRPKTARRLLDKLLAFIPPSAGQADSITMEAPTNPGASRDA